jgi:L-ascorbate metabolism protein UlaG (beta-lactamase superfamily)
MSLKFRWHGHATWELSFAGGSILVDPFFSDNPSAKVAASDLNPGWILVTHGHFDHIADCAAIAARTGATVVANYEVATWLGRQGVTSSIGMNIGGWVKLPFGRVKMVPAWHSSSLPDGSYGGLAAGFVIEVAGRRVWFAGDTALFSDMNLIGEMGIDVAVVPIGDLFTMGIEDSVEAVLLANPKVALPSHYDTWPPIAQDSLQWSAAVTERTSAKAVVLKPGEEFVFETD